MPEASTTPTSPQASPRTIARSLLTIAQNRCELMAIEVQQARQGALHFIFLAAATFLFCLLGLAAFSALVVVSWWKISPTAVLEMLTALYSFIALAFYYCLSHGQRNHQPFATSLDQLKKDRLCLEELLK